VSVSSVSGEPIDPRIRARRVEVIREQGRRRLRILLVSVSLLCVAGLVWLVIQSPLLAVRNVDVSGARRVSTAEVRNAARVGKGAALLTLDRDAVARRVEKLPWIDRVSVTKHLPGKVRITVTERTPAAWARAGTPSPQGGIALVDASGRVLGLAAAPPDGLTELVGLERVPAPGTRVPRTMLEVQRRLGRDLAPFVTGIVSSPRGVSLHLVAGAPAGEIRLGEPTDVTKKVDATLALLRALAGRHVRYVDVSVPQAPASG
jgi:cell division protein FtsQ